VAEKRNRTLVPGVNDLATLYPDTAAQADGWEPATVRANSTLKLGWKCLLGHTWTAQVVERSKGTGCPYCAGKAVWRGFNDLATTNPELASEAHGWDPTTLTAKSGKRRNWICSLGHVWDASPADRSRGDGCAICSNRRVLVGFNDLASNNPELAKQAHGWDPSTSTARSTEQREWICDKGHTWQARVVERQNGTGCPVCANKKIVIGYNDLATTHPDLASQADGWDPTTVVAGATKPYNWVCKRGHLWSMVVRNRTRQGQNCPYCSNHRVLAGFNDLATTNPEWAAQADGWDPTTVLAGSHTKLQWKCEYGHTWKCPPQDRKVGGCPVCSNQQVQVGYNDLATTHPDLAAQADGWDPTTVVAGTQLRLRWICNLEHRWVTTGASRASGQGCPYCSNSKVLAGFNDLATVNPALAAEVFGWDPTTVLPRSSAKRNWICALGHTWEAAIANRSGGSGCPSCSVSGYDPNAEGYLYFLRHDAWGLLQIGITNVPKNRVREHERSGWEIIEIRGPGNGEATYKMEQAIRRSLMRRGVELGPTHIAGKFSGYTESWVRDQFVASSLQELIALVHEDDGTSN
jgi:hypothetical protein